MTSTISTATPVRRRLAVAAVSLTMVTGFAATTASSASAATKAKTKARPALVRKAVVVTPAPRIAIPSVALTPAPAWQTSG